MQNSVSQEHEKQTRKKSAKTMSICMYLIVSLKAHMNFSVFDRPGSKMKDVSENSGYSSDKSLFSKLP